MIHPIFVLFFVMFLGIVAWPMARSAGYTPKGMEADLVAVAALILAYMAYKSWWQKQQGK